MNESSRKAVVIDDDPGVRNYITELLEMEGFEVWEASDGSVGLELIEEVKNIELIITDILMPNKDGIEVLMGLRDIKLKTSLNPKVIAISGGGPHLNPSSFLEDTKGLGADAVIMKPFSIDSFRATLSSIGISVRVLQPSSELASDDPGRVLDPDSSSV